MSDLNSHQNILPKNCFYVVIVKETYYDEATDQILNEKPPCCIKEVYSSFDEAKRSIKAHYPNVEINVDALFYTHEENCECMGKSVVHFIDFCIDFICTDVPIEFIEGNVKGGSND